jgi:ATP-binding cassette subfamily B (MDR/TAP) protein 1
MVQHTCTILATMIMGLQRSPLLAVVILSTIPLSAILTVFSQRFSFPHIMKEREESSATSSVVDRAINAISTVKAFNAQSWESQRANFNLERIRVTTGRLITVWAISQGIGNFTIFSMFVQGFWFGSKMVRDGKLSPGDVLSVFWACLIAASTTSAMVACMMTYSRGKIAMVTLMKLAHPDPSTVKPSTKTSMQPIVKTPKTPLFGGPTFLKPTALQMIRPPTCQGEFNISDLTFAYPSRPDVNVLSNVTLFLPAGEMTFILGGSGSGKSTLSQLLLRLYEPQEGSIELDSRSLNYLDEHWTRSHIAAVSQNTILFDGTVHENVALGIAGGFSGRHPRDVTREEVVAACRVALMHDFIRELPDGYDTKLGSGGASLSGGQKQRLSIARAYIRNPTVLILGKQLF